MDGWAEREALAEQACTFHLAVLACDLFDHIEPDDVLRAGDILRRQRVIHAYDSLEFTADDDFVQDVRLRILYVLQRALETSPAGVLLKSFGLPLIEPSDDELLIGGPSIGDGGQCDKQQRSLDAPQGNSLEWAQ